ncbi:hypothetical protein [Vampirovibrio chlorellavorus]|uniref:hypothetical protein n=1 Tax=Vampirovibrio chlorellavorus TaxID=758823 RepID=UPI0026E93297|nr:hypothetical protein [Vampirovibrio chlorellavorus]
MVASASLDLFTLVFTVVFVLMSALVAIEAYYAPKAMPEPNRLGLFAKPDLRHNDGIQTEQFPDRKLIVRPILFCPMQEGLDRKRLPKIPGAYPVLVPDDC